MRLARKSFVVVRVTSRSDRGLACIYLVPSAPAYVLVLLLLPRISYPTLGDLLMVPVIALLYIVYLCTIGSETSSYVPYARCDFLVSCMIVQSHNEGVL